jgi:chromosome segregation ATPase
MDPDRATSRILTALNALGCGLLIAVIVFQWQRELALGRVLKATTAQLEQASLRAADEAARRQSLERDIELLKESIAATQQAAEDNAKRLGEQTTAAAALATELEAARRQLAEAAERVAAWEAAVQARDARIDTLTRDLTATRKRLDEAVARLKKAGR